jgi:hypothetical protein
MIPSRFGAPDKPAVVKKQRALLAHFSPPVQGLAEAALTAVTDPARAGILTNFYVDDDRITVRAGSVHVSTCVGNAPIEHLIPYYGNPARMAAATNNTWCDADSGALLKSGFTSNDWIWTMFSNLGDDDYVVAVNGNDGVWSWDGSTDPNSAQINIQKIGKATSPAKDAVLTFLPADITKFHAGDSIIITGADAAHAAANGIHNIYSVNNPINTVTLMNVDSSGWAATDQTTGTMRAVVQGSFVQEDVRPPLGNTWLQVNDLAFVTAHMNRLFFADEANLAVYYLPLQQKFGELSVLPLNALFKKGGTVRALASWTIDSGVGLDDMLCIFSTNGEMAVYSGVDPDSDFSLVGVFRFEPPMSRWCLANYGGELYALQATGLTPMSTVIKSGREGAEASDKTLVTRFIREASLHRDFAGWELYFNPDTGRAMCNVPQGGGVYRQLVRNMAKPAWAEWRDIPARCWGWLSPYNYFGDDKGNIYRTATSYQSDERFVNNAWVKLPINVDVQMAWSQFKTPGLKHFKMILPYIVTDGYPQPAIDIKLDFDPTPPRNVPDITGVDLTQSRWDVAPWDTSTWVSGTRSWTNWTGVSGLGRVGAIRLTASIYNCTFSITGFDVLYDSGSVFG